MANEDCSPEQNWPVIAADHSPLYRAEIQNGWCYTSTPVHATHTGFTGFNKKYNNVNSQAKAPVIGTEFC